MRNASKVKASAMDATRKNRNGSKKTNLVKYSLTKLTSIHCCALRQPTPVTAPGTAYHLAKSYNRFRVLVKHF